MSNDQKLYQFNPSIFIHKVKEWQNNSLNFVSTAVIRQLEERSYWPSQITSNSAIWVLRMKYGNGLKESDAQLFCMTMNDMYKNLWTCSYRLLPWTDKEIHAAIHIDHYIDKHEALDPPHAVELTLTLHNIVF